MTPDEFREIALSFEGAIESAHMRHPDFRARGRIFATLSYPDTKTGMVKLALGDQQRLVAAHPHIFYPAQGAWGRAGSTMVHLDLAQPDLMSEALELAWHNNASTAPSTKPRKQSTRK